MRTTIVLEDALVAEARRLLGGRTLRGLLETALREAVRARQRQMLLDAIASGASALAITEDDLDAMRRDRPVAADWAAVEVGGSATGSKQRSASGGRGRRPPTT